MFYQPVPPTKHMLGTEASWEIQLPASVMQFLCLLHNLRPRDPLWASPDFLHALAGVVYPLDASEVCVILRIYESLNTSHPSGLVHWFTYSHISYFRVWLSLA